MSWVAIEPGDIHRQQQAPSGAGHRLRIAQPLRPCGGGQQQQPDQQRTAAVRTRGRTPDGGRRVGRHAGGEGQEQGGALRSAPAATGAPAARAGAGTAASRARRNGSSRFPGRPFRLPLKTRARRPASGYASDAACRPRRLGRAQQVPPGCRRPSRRHRVRPRNRSSARRSVLPPLAAKAGDGITAQQVFQPAGQMGLVDTRVFQLR